MWVRFPCASANPIPPHARRRSGPARFDTTRPHVTTAAATDSPAIDPKGLRRVVIGTAGHIDHGKTQLIRALTGIDCDRWQEEKARGITLDLGFAHLFAGDLQIGFIDVPGHKRFLDNALAGMGGIRVVLLVVAATEGVMPQTREHLSICSLLGISSAVVALTKTDLAEADLVDMAHLDVAELLEDTPFAGAPVVPVSSATGDGLDELRRVLLEAAEANEVRADTVAPARLPIDRAFHLHGLGVVVTGTLTGGSIRSGDTLTLFPAEKAVRVRDTHVHGAGREEVVQGERVSLRLAGADLDELARGMQLATPKAFETTRSLAVRLDVLTESPVGIEAGTEVRCHLLAGDAMARIRPLDSELIPPGADGIVELSLAEPLVAIRGDRVILRRPTPAATIGGGVVLDPAWRRRRKHLREDLERLAAGDTDTYEVWIEREGARGLLTGDIARRTGRPPAELDVDLRGRAAAGGLLELPAVQGQGVRWIATSSLDRLRDLADRVLERHFARDRLSLGVAKAEFARRLLPGVPEAVVDDLIRRLTEMGKIQLTAGIVAPPGRTVELRPEEKELLGPIRTRYEEAGLEPPTLAELHEEVGGTDRAFQSTVRFLVDSQALLRLPNQELLSAAAFQRMREEMLDAGWERFSVPQFKDQFGLTRKWAIPILEYCDSQGLTKRAGNERLLMR